LEQYEATLIQEGIKNQAEIDEMKQEVWSKLSQALEKSNSQDYKPESREWLTEAWENMKSPMELSTQVLPPKPTAVDQPMIEIVGQQLGADAVPEGFQLYKSLERVLSRRKQTIEGHIDWSTAEALVFGSLCVEGYHVRLSGQDVERGTFS
jgi:2-oxoglutarate dehydrogenase E1 component